MRSLDFETRTALARFDQTLFYSHVMHVIFICNVFSFLFQFKRDGWVILKCHYDMCSFSCYFEWISILFFFFFLTGKQSTEYVRLLASKQPRKERYLIFCHYLCHRNIMEVHWIIKSIYSRPGWVLYFPPSKPLAFCCVYDKDFLLRFL